MEGHWVLWDMGGGIVGTWGGFVGPQNLPEGLGGLETLPREGEAYAEAIFKKHLCSFTQKQ